LLKVYANEFVKIVDYVIKNNLGYVHKETIAIPKDIIIEAMQYNMYEEPREKLRIWRSLNWISTEKERYTKMVRIDKETKRLVVVNADVYNTLKIINEKTFN
jgi:expansin (peptidoglycan-binding protein)